MKNKTVIPFSKFVNITTSGKSSAFTFNRLNPLAITQPVIPMQQIVEVTSVESVAKLYGVGSKEYSYATEFFGYTSKNATKAEKLTFYNNYSKPQKAAIVGAAISMLSEIKKEGSLNLTINSKEHKININLENIVSFSDAANAINEKLKHEKVEAVPNSLTGTAVTLPVSATTTIAAEKFIIKNETDETVFTYTASITFETSDNIDKVITKLNNDSLKKSNLVWSKVNNGLMLSQTSYFATANTIPAKIELSDAKLKSKLGLDNITVKKGSAEIPAGAYGTCEYNTLTNGFIIYSAEAGAEQTINFATGDLASVLGIAETSGGYVTSSSDGENISEILNNIGIINGDYVTVASLNNIDSADYEKIASWTNASNGRYAFMVLSSDARLKSTSQAVYESLFGNDGFILIYGSNINMLAFMQAAIASVDFSIPNGMTNFNFIETPEFLNDAIGLSEELDGINANRANCCYIMGGYGQKQPLFGEGKIFGTNFNNIANYIGNSWIKAKMEIAGANLMISQNFIALRGGNGKSMILATMQEIINIAKISGIIVTVGSGELLSEEKSKIISVTGNSNAVNLIENNGYYINVLPATSDDIAKEQMKIQFIYTKNVPTNRLVIQTFVI